MAGVVAVVNGCQRMFQCTLVNVHTVAQFFQTGVGVTQMCIDKAEQNGGVGGQGHGLQHPFRVEKTSLISILQLVF